MHQLGRPGRRPARQIVHFAQENSITAADRVTRDAATVNTASNDGEVENTLQQTHPPETARSVGRQLSFLIRSHCKTKARRKRGERKRKWNFLWEQFAVELGTPSGDS